MNIFPFRLRYSKTGRLRFLSHHDMIRLWERAIRRSGIPIRFSQGFNPHPAMSFPTATALGVESRDEVLELELSTWLAPRAIQSALQAQLPEGIAVEGVEAFTRADRSGVDYVEYEAAVAAMPPEAAEKARAFLAKESAVVDRPRDWGVQVVDVRPYVLALEVEGSAVRMRIRVTDAGTARPDEVLGQLGIPRDGRTRVVKTRTVLRRRAPPRPAPRPSRRR